MYAQVALPIPKRTLFTYLLPVALEESAQLGSLALVPFGTSHRVGIIWRLDPLPQWQEGVIRPILDILGDGPLLDQNLRDLLDWISRYYIRPLGSVVAAALPGHLLFDRHLRISWRSDQDPAAIEQLSPSLRPLALAIQSHKRGGMSRENLARTFGTAHLELRLRKLLQQELITLEEDWRPRHRLGKPKEKEETDVFLETDPLPPPTPTPEQEVCAQALLVGLYSAQFSPFLLQGVTGSGKTELYFRLVEACLALDRQALLLVPEISLTPQLMHRFRKRFQKKLAVFHSGLSSRQRYLFWHQVRCGEAQVAIGARSALFAPFKRLGLIVVDEEHDSSYKQEEGGIPYHARDMAVVRAKACQATLILGSATPSMESLANVRNGKYHPLFLTKRATGSQLPKVELVNLLHPKARENRPSTALIGTRLVQSIQNTLDQERQVLLFLNRRGFAPSLLCHACGQTIYCRHCSVTLTLHKSHNKLICHYCGYLQAVEDVCTVCGQMTMAPFGPGTEQVEEEVRGLFPKARVVRLDRDSVQAQGGDPQGVLEAFEQGMVDILVGTQMAAKGHHFPGLALVGVILAETTLFMPDFRAAERTFQMLTQVGGRAGREEVPGEVLIQTLDPSHYALQAALTHDVAAFAKIEMHSRAQIGYPPEGRLALLRFSGPNQKGVIDSCSRLKNRLPTSADAEFFGPAPAPIEKIRNRYRWQLLIKEKPGGRLHRVLLPVLELAENQAVPGLRIEVDVDPQSFL
ncbi:MAG: primosomal protein N' [Magnetococcus sp. DMHC-6]